MGNVSIHDPQAQGLEGVSFTGSVDGAAHRFLALREGLEDLEYTLLESPEAMLAAFQRQQSQVAAAAAQALAAGSPGEGPIVLQSLLV